MRTRAAITIMRADIIATRVTIIMSAACAGQSSGTAIGTGSAGPFAGITDRRAPPSGPAAELTP